MLHKSVGWLDLCRPFWILWRMVIVWSELISEHEIIEICVLVMPEILSWLCLYSLQCLHCIIFRDYTASFFVIRPELVFPLNKTMIWCHGYWRFCSEISCSIYLKGLVFSKNIAGPQMCHQLSSDQQQNKWLLESLEFRTQVLLALPHVCGCPWWLSLYLISWNNCSFH